MCEYGPREAGEILAEKLGADLVAVTGTRFILYRESKKKKRIELPK
jgi:RNA-binding protein